MANMSALMLSHQILKGSLLSIGKGVYEQNANGT